MRIAFSHADPPPTRPRCGSIPDISPWNVISLPDAGNELPNGGVCQKEKPSYPAASPDGRLDLLWGGL